LRAIPCDALVAGVSSWTGEEVAVACTPFSPPQAGLFQNSTQGVWNNANETKGNRAASYSSGRLTVTGANGSLTFFTTQGQVVRHKFFGIGNFLAVLTSGTGPGPVQHSMVLVDFTTALMTSKQVLFVGADSSNPLPWLQHSQGSGTACLVGAPTNFGVAGLAILRSDSGKLICSGPSPYAPNVQVIGEATSTKVQIKDGGTVLPGASCAFPTGSLDVQPNDETFAPVKVGGCPQPPSTKQFTLKNVGDDCLTVSAIASAAPFSLTAQSKPFPAELAASESMTATVTFAPTAVGSFNNVILAVTRSPANGDNKLICSGQAQTAEPGCTVNPSSVGFGQALVGSTKTDSFTIANTGEVPLSVNVAASSAGPFQWGGFSGSLSCGQQRSISVSFTPQAEGSAQASVSVIVSAGPNKTVTLTGDGCIPNATINTPPLPFPAYGDVRQGYRMPRFVTVRNTGDDTLTFAATISGPDAALFGLMQASESITDVVPTRSYTIHPSIHCGGGPTGDGAEEVVVVFFGNATPPKTATATLTIDSHNDPTAAPSFAYPLAANIVPANAVDAVAVFDTSGSMADPIPGGGNKMTAAIQAGKLLVQLIPSDVGNRFAATRFSTDAATFLTIEEVNAGNQQVKTAAIADPPLSPLGWTAIAAGAMTGSKEFATPHTGTPPANLTNAMVVLTDGKDNTAYLNPDDGKYYSILGGQSQDPANVANKVATNPFAPPAGVKVYGVGLGTGQDIDSAQLAALSTGAGGYYGAVDPTQPAVTYQLMKFYTQIFMDMVDTMVIKDPKFVIPAGQTDVHEFDILQGDVSVIVVVYDFEGLRLPFWLETPGGEVVDATFVPGGFQLRSGFTDAARFVDFQLPLGNPKRYAGRWRLIVKHDGRVCAGDPELREQHGLGFLPLRCRRSRQPVEYGFAIGVGSNFRLQAYVSPGPVEVGDPIRLVGVPTEAALPVLGCGVTVDTSGPSGQKWPTIVLADDGGHDDGDADDGEYAGHFTNTVEAGTYTFTFRATGFSRDGEPVHREAVRSKYVDGWIRQPPSEPPHDGGGMDDDCCERIVRQLERQGELLEDVVRNRRR
jgi:von Willebrand factor type A domain/Abnormal spindle-like microcephaly-assoc'd, ASPM-SPD-2-Hydin